MNLAQWSVIVGLLLVVMALSSTVLARLPLSTAMFYLLVGIAISPWGAGMLWAGPATHTLFLERLSEVVLLVSLFSAGLKLSPGLNDKRWLLPLRLALTSMLITVTLIALIGVFLLKLPLGAAVLLGAILAPTDPVLASDVQMQSAGDRDHLRFALTGEGGLNDGSAFPFVMLGLGLLGLHDVGEWGWKWVAVDVVWGSVCGLAVGAALGTAVGRLVLYLRRTHQEAVGTDDFLALGLIGLSYGVAVLAHGYGFLAVFAAGVALRHLERRETASAATAHGAPAAGEKRKEMSAEDTAVDPQRAPAHMAQEVLGFNEKLERIGEVAVVIAVGALLWAVVWIDIEWWLVPLLLLVVRPVSVALGLWGSRSSSRQRLLIGWFGIRGIGSLYYLMYAINHGLPQGLANKLTALTLLVIVSSIVLHGVSVTPLMKLYEKSRNRPRRRGRGTQDAAAP